MCLYHLTIVSLTTTMTSNPSVSSIATLSNITMSTTTEYITLHDTCSVSTVFSAICSALAVESKLAINS